MREEIDPEKPRDMVRSILPSTRRRNARYAKAFVKRRHRRQIHEDVHHDDPATTASDLSRDVNADMGGIVRYRRSGDKLNHFLRWCEQITDGMGVDEALAYVRKLLPASVIGNHAYRHWRGAQQAAPPSMRGA